MKWITMLLNFLRVMVILTANCIPLNHLISLQVVFITLQVSTCLSRLNGYTAKIYKGDNLIIKEGHRLGYTRLFTAINDIHTGRATGIS